MIPQVPKPEDYSISSNGFLPEEPPLSCLPDPYYHPWEQLISNLQPLLLTRRIRELVDELPELSTDRLYTTAEWRRAYVVLSFLAHAYIWGGDRPADELPRPLSIPFLDVSQKLELPPVASYAALCLWNYRPLFSGEPIDILENLATLHTFSGSLDEAWFYLVSVAIEARGAPTIQLMLNAIHAARRNDAAAVVDCLQIFAERLDELGSLLVRMYDMCDPHTFYYRVRPYLAGSKNMADAGLPHGVKYLDGSGTEAYRQYSGGSNAQSSLIQAFDILLGVEHRPTGEAKNKAEEAAEGTAPPRKHNFIQEMRLYMPGPHRRFLEDLSRVANIREFVEENSSNGALTVSFDACLSMLRTFRDKHIQIVSRYIILPAKEAKKSSAASINLPIQVPKPQPKGLANSQAENSRDKRLRGTGGTALIPFLKQARDETGEPSISTWAQRILTNSSSVARDRQLEEDAKAVKIPGLAAQWLASERSGGGSICHW